MQAPALRTPVGPSGTSVGSGCSGRQTRLIRSARRVLAAAAAEEAAAAEGEAAEEAAAAAAEEEAVRWTFGPSDGSRCSRPFTCSGPSALTAEAAEAVGAKGAAALAAGVEGEYTMSKHSAAAAAARTYITSEVLEAEAGAGRYTMGKQSEAAAAAAAAAACVYPPPSPPNPPRRDGPSPLKLPSRARGGATLTPPPPANTLRGCQYHQCWSCPSLPPAVGRCRLTLSDPC